MHGVSSRDFPAITGRSTRPGPAITISVGRVSNATPTVDADFRALPLAALTDAALSAARAAGAEHADLRVHRALTQSIRLRDGRVESVGDADDLGFAVRVLVDGTWGFASHCELTPDAAADVARKAVAVATITRALNRERVELADEPVYRDVSWVSPYRTDPFAVPTADKVALLQDYSRRLADADGVDHVTASILQVKEQTYYADTAGSVITQQRVRLHPALEAITVGESGFESMRTLAPPVGRGWEYVTGADGMWDWDGELARIPGWLAEKVTAPSVEPGPTDLVIDPSNLWLTIHESIGHATEYDRAIGYESAYAGTSFATPDQLGTLRYGSPVMHVTGDRTIEHGLATIGYDDEGVAGQSWDLVRDGTLVGYQLDRAFAPRLGVARSNGCSYADSPHHVPIQRMANVSLQPDPDNDTSTADLISRAQDGIYIVGDRSWSIDMQRYNFQFTGQRFFRIRDGELAGQLRDVAYQATTTEFWGAMEAVGGPSTWVLGGAFNCGKAQPGQIASVSHGCPSVLVRGVNILNTRQEADR
ncbi:MAG: TldD/PmbA family protein [Nocardia sp.]|nr:TldD/PmbA family protein [Nocardia sp.]